MNTRTLATVFVGVALASGALAAGDVFVNDFSSDPGGKAAPGKLPGEAKNQSLSLALPLPPTQGKSFVAEFDLDIQVFNHYGQLFLTFANSAGPQKLKMTFTREDDRIARCYVAASAAPGLDSKAKTFEGIGVGKYHVTVAFAAIDKAVSLSFASAGKQVYSSGPMRVSGKFAVDKLVVAVLDNGIGASDVSYDAPKQNLFFRSYVGVEGEYPYVLEGSVDDLAMKVKEE